ncbi:hypothetical protein [Pelotomaculum schinkii]|nr:hypothetical protein [Pelotomaculum schinkii]
MENINSGTKSLSGDELVEIMPGINTDDLVALPSMTGMNEIFINKL